MQTLLNYSQELIEHVVFPQVSPYDLIKNRSVSQAWNNHVSKDKACSIIESTYRIAKDLFEGKILEPQITRNQMEVWLYTMAMSKFSDSPKYGSFRYYIKPPKDQLGYVPFNALNHLSQEEKETLNSQILASIPPHLKQDPSLNEFENSMKGILEKTQMTEVRLGYKYEPKNLKAKIEKIDFLPVKEEGQVHVDNDTIKKVKDFFKDIPISFSAKEIPEKTCSLIFLDGVKERNQSLYPL